jgi:hypothetical protein
MGYCAANDRGLAMVDPIGQAVLAPSSTDDRTIAHGTCERRSTDTSEQFSRCRRSATSPELLRHRHGTNGAAMPVMAEGPVARLWTAARRARCSCWSVLVPPAMQPLP